MSKTTLNKIFLLSAVMLFTISIFTLLAFSGDSKAKAGQTMEESSEPLQEVTVPPIPTELSFAEEVCPVEQSGIRENFERELLVNTYWHSSTILLLKRANRWFPVIEPILDEYSIPEDFKYLALIESGFMKVVSPKGAAGYWQFLEKTAREYDLEVNSNVDERYNVEKATAAACRYFMESYAKYGNWTLVAASYNAGNRRISEALEEQKTGNYYDLYLNEETSRYVYRILAIKTICENPVTYGFMIPESDLYPPYKTQDREVASSISNLTDFAREYGMTYKQLKEFNPWLKGYSLSNPSGKKYVVKISAD